MANSNNIVVEKDLQDVDIESNMPKLQVPLTALCVESLPDEEDCTCVICLDEIGENERIEFSCKHVLHVKCGQELCYKAICDRKDITCPTCRAVLVSLDSYGPQVFPEVLIPSSVTVIPITESASLRVTLPIHRPSPPARARRNAVYNPNQVVVVNGEGCTGARFIGTSVFCLVFMALILYLTLRT